MPTKRFGHLRPERRKKILAAAIQEFSEKGYEGSSLNTICQKAEFSKGSLYYYFADKDDLYITVLTETVSEMAQLIGGIVTGEYSSDYWGDVRMFSVKMVGLKFTKPELVHLAREIMSLSSNKYKSGPVAEFSKKGTDSIGEILRYGQKMGVLRDDIPLGLLVNIVLALGIAFDNWIGDNRNEILQNNIEHVADQCVDTLKCVMGV